MARWLKQSTSADVPIGPFVDATDGVTAETALTITQPDVRLKKNAGAWAQKAAAQTLTHEENGNYEVTLDATDTDTVGLLRLHVAESGALPVWEDFLVVPGIVYDSFFPAAAGNPLPLFGILDWGTAQASAAGTLVHRAGLSLADDIPNGATEFVYGATGAGQARSVHDFVGATDTASISPNWTTTPDGTSLYATFASPPGSTSSPLPANLTQWLGTAAATPTVGGVPEVDVTHWIGTAAATPTVAGVPEVDATHYLGSAAPALVGGRFDASVGAMAANTLTATAINADAITAAKVAADVGTEIAAAVGTRSIPDSYAADGAQPTIDQAILATLQCLTEAVVSGATILIKKPDGTTTAMTITCSPSVAAATSRTRSA